MGRQRKGTVDKSGGRMRLVVPVTAMRDGKEYTHRLRIPVAGDLSEAEAEAQAQQLTDHFAGRVVDPKKVYDTLRGVSYTTIAEFVDRVYLPTRTAQKSYAYQAAAWRNHILPTIGALDVRTFDAEHLRGLVRALDEKASDDAIKFGHKNATNVWGIVTKFCADLVSSKLPDVRIRKVNPCRDVAPPDRGKKKTLQWLYPNELQKLLACVDVPTHRRRMYALYVYLFCRAGELPPLEFGHNLDLEHWMVTIDRKLNLRTKEVDLHTKADGRSSNARSFPIEPVIAPLLERMRVEAAEAGRRTLLDFSTVTDDGADILRSDLWAAGVRRAALHERVSRDSLPIRLHDLRATGITYLAIRGHSDNEIRDRAGHADFDMTKDYIRRGRLASKYIGEPFQPLPKSLLWAATRLRKHAGSGGSGGTIYGAGEDKSSPISSQHGSENPESVMNSGFSEVRRKGLEPFIEPFYGKNTGFLSSNESENHRNDPNWDDFGDKKRDEKTPREGAESALEFDDTADPATVSGPVGASAVDAFSIPVKGEK